MPAHPDDEPRIPQIYRQAWQGEPDALLALIRSALRLDRVTVEDEQALADETLDLDDLEHEPEQAAPPTPPTPRVQLPVLKRYRNALVKLLERGDTFVRAATNPDLADLGFQSVLRLHERLAGLNVEVDGFTQPLVEPDVLRQHKLALLSSYLRDRDGRDPQCLATARVHLADCLGTPDLWQPLEWETLETLAYATSPAILASNAYVAEAAADAHGDAIAATARLRPYAQRAEWAGFFIQAEVALDSFDFDTAPFPWVRGADWYDEFDLSPAWRLAGYAALVSFSPPTPYAVVVENRNSHSNHTTHLIVVDPVNHILHESWRRRSDGAWLTRTYHPIAKGTVDRIYKIGVEALSDLSRSAFTNLDPATFPTAICAWLTARLNIDREPVS
jgi:hypothetical protein